MLHAQIESEEIVERYVRNQLSPGERHAFEEHFFSCDECFDKLQASERFFAGVREAAGCGMLAGEAPAIPAGVAGAWPRWAFALCACTAVMFCALSAWMFFGRIPALERDLHGADAQLQVQRRTLAKLQQRAAVDDSAEANLPLVILQASRGQEKNVATIPQDARQLVVWVEVGPTRFQRFRLDIYSRSNQPVASVTDLKVGPYGALAVSLPASQLPAGDFRVTLMSQDPPPASLVGEYQLQIRKP
jgi:hypothetical protein